MANQNMMQVSLGSKQNPMNLIVSGHDRGIQLSFKSKGNKKSKIVCSGGKQIWIPPPAKSARYRSCCLYPNNEIMLRLPEDGKFLLPHGLPLIIESSHLENFKASIYPPKAPDIVPSPISVSSLDDYYRRLKDSYEKQNAAVKVSEKLLKEHGGKKSTLSKHINTLKENLEDIQKCIKEIEVQASGAPDKVSKNKTLVQGHNFGKYVRKRDIGNGVSLVETIRDNVSEEVTGSEKAYRAFLEFQKQKDKSNIQSTKIKIPPEPPEEKHINRQGKIKWIENGDKHVTSRGRVPTQDAMINLANTIRKSKELIGSVIEDKERVNDLERAYIRNVENLDEDQQRLLGEVCQVFKRFSIISSQDVLDDDYKDNQPKDPLTGFDGDDEFGEFESINAAKFKLNSMPDIESVLRNQTMAEKLARMNFELETMKKELQLMKMKGIETKQTQNSVKGSKKAHKNADTEDSSVNEVIRAINHKYNILRRKTRDGNIYETTGAQKFKNVPIIYEDSPESLRISNNQYLNYLCDAQNAMKKLEENFNKMIPILPYVSRQQGIGPETSNNHCNEIISADILRESEIRKELIERDEQEAREEKYRDVETQVPEASSADTEPKPRDDAPRPRDDAPRPRDDAPRPRDDAPRPRDDASRPADDARRQENFPEHIADEINVPGTTYITEGNAVGTQEDRHVNDEKNVQQNASDKVNMQGYQRLGETSVPQYVSAINNNETTAHEQQINNQRRNLKPSDERFQVRQKSQRQKRVAGSTRSKPPTDKTFDNGVKLCNKGSSGFDVSDIERSPSTSPLENQYTFIDNGGTDAVSRETSSREETIPKTRKQDQVQEVPTRDSRVSEGDSRESFNRARLPSQILTESQRNGPPRGSRDSSQAQRDSINSLDFRDILESTRVAPKDSVTEREDSESLNQTDLPYQNLSEERSQVPRSSELLEGTIASISQYELEEGTQDDLEQHTISDLSNYELDEDNEGELEEGTISDLSNYELDENNQEELEEGAISDLSNYELDEDNQEELEEGTISDLSNYELDEDNQEELEEGTISDLSNYELDENNQSEPKQLTIPDLSNYELVHDNNEAVPTNSNGRHKIWYRLDTYDGSTLDDDTEEEHRSYQRRFPAYGRSKSYDAKALVRNQTNFNGSPQEWYRLDTYKGSTLDDTEENNGRFPDYGRSKSYDVNALVRNQRGPANSSEPTQKWHRLDTYKGSTLDDTEEENGRFPTYGRSRSYDVNALRRNQTNPANSNNQPHWYRLDTYDGSTIDDSEEHRNDQFRFSSHNGVEKLAENQTKNESFEPSHHFRSYVGSSFREMDQEGNNSSRAKLQYDHPKMTFDSQPTNFPKHLHEESHRMNQEPGTSHSSYKDGNILDRKSLYPKITFNNKLSTDIRVKGTSNNTEYEKMAEDPNLKRWKYDRKMLSVNPDQYKRSQAASPLNTLPRFRNDTQPNLKFHSTLPSYNNKFIHQRHTFDSNENDKYKRKIRKLYDEIMS